MVLEALSQVSHRRVHFILKLKQPTTKHSITIHTFVIRHRPPPSIDTHILMVHIILNFITVTAVLLLLANERLEVVNSTEMLYFCLKVANRTVMFYFCLKVVTRTVMLYFFSRSCK